MSKRALAVVVAVLIAGLLVPAAFAATNNSSSNSSAGAQASAPPPTWFTLTPDQQQQIQDLQQQILDVQKKIIDKYVEFGAITKAQGDWAKQQVEYRYKNRSQLGIPGLGGFGRHGWAKRGYGGYCPYAQTPAPSGSNSVS
ncbi:MAG: DUF2680 domain-containing protein [Clostridia bacterium]|nr:DUF2680 domain-containing protein [Clostridia bacterium]